MAADTNVGGRPDKAASSVRERILESAIAVLSEEGIAGFSQVQVARRAGVRQSHLTYYFPKRHDLISAVAERVVSILAAHMRETLSDSRRWDLAAVLRRLAEGIATQGHMRMFTGTIVEADGDPQVRSILKRETAHLQEVLAEALPGENAEERARVVLASIWGFGLYSFVAGEPPGDIALLLDLPDRSDTGRS